MIKTKRSRKYYNPQREDENKCCDYPGCTRAGEYRAPKDRNLKDYYWFCLEHVQNYNSKWNYYDGISDQSPEDDEKAHSRFHRFGSNIKYSFIDGFEFFDGYENDFSVLYTKEELKFFAVLEIKPSDASLELIKQQYKKLAKVYHPDLNQGDKKKEEQFKGLNIAYKYLLNKFS